MSDKFRLVPMRKFRVTVTARYTRVFWSDKPEEALVTLKKHPEDLLEDVTPTFKMKDVTGDVGAIPTGAFDGVWWTEEEINDGQWTDEDDVPLRPSSVTADMARFEAAGQRQRRLPFPPSAFPRGK